VNGDKPVDEDPVAGGGSVTGGLVIDDGSALYVVGRDSSAIHARDPQYDGGAWCRVRA